MSRGRYGLWAVLIALLGLSIAAAACTSAPAAGAASSTSSKPAAASGIDGDAKNGANLFQSKGCIACHTAAGVPGANGTIGPNLNGIGDPSKRPTLADGEANTPEHIREWILDPNSKKPGTMMPNLQLSQKEANDLTAFLLTLTK